MKGTGNTPQRTNRSYKLSHIAQIMASCEDKDKTVRTLLSVLIKESVNGQALFCQLNYLKLDSQLCTEFVKQTPLINFTKCIIRLQNNSSLVTEKCTSRLLNGKKKVGKRFLPQNKREIVKILLHKYYKKAVPTEKIWKSLQGFISKLKINLPHDVALIYTAGHDPKFYMYDQRDICHLVYSFYIHNR